MSNAKKKLLVLSTSTVHAQPYLMYCKTDIQAFFAEAKKILFIPYARPSGISHEAYTETAGAAFQHFNMELRGIESFQTNEEALSWARGIFIGGGNSFLLLKTLLDRNLFSLIQNAVEAGMPYMGTSAGSNLCGLTIGTSNDMPIVYPSSFDAFGFFNFNINPHYLDPDPNSKHMGETRETRILEFHHFNKQAVVGLREGSYLWLEKNRIHLKGPHSARIFEAGKEPYELASGSDLTKLN